ncbi:hypothetical protein CHS0354_035725 [Potamilus streckersoni]|uniref:Uncharacterized protein n=1 Tax=Potamilus streckersoni TaxID=2493646 RepID=A0AAE0S0C6_9BIVA|nr:hypothetical protein CHS0354_035725 [Potamilus streckersoni]
MWNERRKDKQTIRVLCCKVLQEACSTRCGMNEERINKLLVICCKVLQEACSTRCGMNEERINKLLESSVVKKDKQTIRVLCCKVLQEACSTRCGMNEERINKLLESSVVKYYRRHASHDTKMNEEMINKPSGTQQTERNEWRNERGNIRVLNTVM